MDRDTIQEITREEISGMSLKERAAALEKIMEAAELLVEEMGRLALGEDIELFDRN